MIGLPNASVHTSLHTPPHFVLQHISITFYTGWRFFLHHSTVIYPFASFNLDSNKCFIEELNQSLNTSTFWSLFFYVDIPQPLQILPVLPALATVFSCLHLPIVMDTSSMAISPSKLGPRIPSNTSCSGETEQRERKSLDENK